MNLHHLKVFHMVAEANSISLAAERLFISQPAVTREVRELESTLGVVLFNRLPRGVALTDGGKLLAQFATRIFALERAAEVEMRALTGLTAGELRLGASTIAGVYTLPIWISQFHAAYPNIEITLRVMSNMETEVEAGLLNHHFTLGFAEGPVNPKLFSFDLIGQDSIVAVTHPKHPLTAKKSINAIDLADRIVFMCESGSSIRTTIENAYRAIGLTIQSSLSVGSVEAIKQILLVNGGAAWLPAQALRQELKLGALIQLTVDDLAITRQLYMAWPKGQILSPSANAFRQMIVKSQTAN